MNPNLLYWNRQLRREDDGVAGNIQVVIQRLVARMLYNQIVGAGLLEVALLRMGRRTDIVVRVLATTRLVGVNLVLGGVANSDLHTRAHRAELIVLGPIAQVISRPDDELTLPTHNIHGRIDGGAGEMLLVIM